MIDKVTNNTRLIRAKPMQEFRAKGSNQRYSGVGKFCRFEENKLRLAKSKRRFQKNKCH